MDSITQAALGASIAAVAAGKRCNGKVLIAGALLGTLPDLDILFDYGDAITNTVKHRGFSHSLLMLIPFSWLLAFILHHFKPITEWSFARLGSTIMAILVTHPLLDFFTSYGTQLTWPIDGYYALSSIFIIDPLYTVPLLIAIGFTLKYPQRALRYNSIALLLSSLYLGWGVYAQHLIYERTEQTLRALNLPRAGISTAQIFITPTPLNTVLWRVVVLDGDRYLEGLASLLDKDTEIHFLVQQNDPWPTQQKPSLWQDLRTFSHDLLSYQIEQNKFIVTDLRMGMGNNYAFQFLFVEQNTQGQWLLVDPPQRYGERVLNGDYRRLFDRLLGDDRVDALLGDCGHCTSIKQSQG